MPDLSPPQLEPLRLAMLSIHTSPEAALGGKKTGGMNVYVREVSREMARRGIRVDIFTRASSPEETGKIVELSPFHRLIYLPCGPAQPLDTSVIFLHLGQFKQALEDFVQREGIRYDALYSHYWLSGWVAVQLRKKWGVPVAQMFHTLGHMKNRISDNRRNPDNDIRIRGEMEIIKHVDRIIAATPAEYTQLLMFYCADRRRIDIVPPG
ncbi:MAG: glycosyltransferase, partial [Anaerolineae bacterium]|nr:glycosyltransferase [Anaerolineae bacterium]